MVYWIRHFQTRAKYVRQENGNRHRSIGGIGASLVEPFVKGGYNVVATSRNFNQSLISLTHDCLAQLSAGRRRYRQAGDRRKTVEAAIKHFGTIDVLLNNAGIFRTKPFTDFTTQDCNALVSTNLLGFRYITQLTVKQMLKTEIGERCEHHSGACRSASRRRKCLGLDDYEEGLNAVIRSLAIEYAKEGIRFNAVAPGVVDSPLHKDDPKDSLKKFQPMGKSWR